MTLAMRHNNNIKDIQILVGEPILWHFSLPCIFNAKHESVNVITRNTIIYHI